MSFHSRKFRLDLSTARDNVRIEIKGGFVRVTGASIGTASIDISVDNNIGTNDQFTMRKGDAMTYGPGFDKLYITHAAQSGHWIEFAVSPSKDIFDFEVGQNFIVDSISDPVVTRGGNTMTYAAHTAGVAAAVVLAANTARTSYCITNNGTVVVYIGSDASVTTATGTPLAVGEKFAGTGTHALYSISGTAAQNCRVLEETKV